MTTANRLGPVYDPMRNRGVPFYPFIYIGFVKDNKDGQRMGRLSVWIPELGGDPDDDSSWIIASYCSPFAGATDINSIKGYTSNPQVAQQSYGLWLVPPDLNCEVAVFFANGDVSRAYWMGCTYQQFMNHMVPGVAVDITTEEGKKVSPVIEYNKADKTITPTKPRRPPFKPLTEGLKTEGLDKDNERGPASTSARREAPSQVFGLLSPAGNTMHIDDNPENSFIRLRTKSGTQVLIDDTTGFVYINTKNGDAWLEISDAGVDCYSKNSISFRAENDFNIRADQNIIFDAGKDINLRAGHDVTIEAGHDMQTKVGHNDNLTVQNNKSMTVGQQLNAKTGDNINIESTKDFSTKAGGRHLRDGGSGIYDNSGGAASAGGGNTGTGQATGTGSGKQADAVNAMQGHLGQNGAQMNDFIKANGGTLDASRNNWCAASANAALSSAGIQGTGSNVATSFLNWGNSVNGSPQSGDVMVEGRGLSAGQVGGHVGFATGQTRTDANGQTQYQMISGNYGNKVSTSWVNATSVTVRRASATTTSAMIATIFRTLRAPFHPKATSARIVPYDPSSTRQQQLLSGIAQGETGGKANAAFLGVGGHDLSGAPTNQYGFPDWQGQGNSHASGYYQFQPATWNSIAGQYNLNFQNAADQSAGAWYLAQQVYAKNNPGDTLSDALERGDNQKIQDSLQKTWTSSNGNASNPDGLASYLGSGKTNSELANATGATDHVTTSPDGAVTPDGKAVPDSGKGGDGTYKPGASTVKTICSRMPTHEPFSGHPKNKVPAPPVTDAVPFNGGSQGRDTNKQPSSDQKCDFGASNTSPISNENYTAIAAAAAKAGVPLSYALAVADLQTEFATPPFQFSQSSWNAMVQQYGNQYNISTDPAEQNDPQANAMMGAQQINSAMQQLGSMGVSNPSAGLVYIMTYMGTDGGPKLIDAAQTSPDADASTIFPSAAASDPQTFQGKTVGQVYDLLSNLGDLKGRAYGDEDSNPTQTPPCNRSV